MNILVTRPTVGSIASLPGAVARRWPALAVATLAVAIPTGVALAAPPQSFPDGIVTSFLHVTNGAGQGQALFDLGLIADGFTAVEANGTSTGVSAGGQQTGVSAVGVNGFGLDARGPTAVRAESDGTTAIEADGAPGSGTAIKATSSSSIDPTVEVTNTGTNGVAIDASGANGGVNARSSNAVGVRANGKTGGVLATSFGGTGTGISAFSDTEPGIFAEGTYGGDFHGLSAPVRLEPAATAGAPTSGSHKKGELYVDSNGLLFFCTADGTPGTWKHVVLQ